MQDFPPNSDKARRARSEDAPLGERPKIDRVTTAEVDRRRRGLGKRFKDVFIGGDARMARDYVITDIVIPEVRDLLFNAIQGSLDRYIYGDNTRRSRRYGYGPPTSTYSNTSQPQVNYQGMSTNRPISGTRMLSRQARTRQSFDEIVISSRVEAQEVLDQMYEFLSRYGQVRVDELYGMTGIESTHTDHKWGWTSLTGARVARMRDGRYLLDLPEPQPL